LRLQSNGTCYNTPHDPRPKRRWFRFSMRTLFAVVTVVCVWVGWNVNAVRTRQSMRKDIEASGGIFSSVGGNISKVRDGDQNWKPTLIRRALGDSAAFGIFFNRFTTPEDIQRSGYFPEAQVYEWADSFGGRRTYKEAMRDFEAQKAKSSTEND
jgi:hypothetical protein